MIEVSGLTKRYGNKIAVNDVSFVVNEGEILGLLGPNGAGKTTTMNIMTGYISSNEGTVKIGGYDILDNPNEAKARMGYLPEHPPLYTDMTVNAYLSFVYDLKKCKLSKSEHIKEIAELVKIDNVSERVIKHLSKGYQQRVGLAGALVGNPEYLILDEPTVGLDPKQIIEIRRLIKQLSKKHTVILSSHILPEIQAVCDRIIVINEGVIVADNTAENLSREISEDFGYLIKVQGPQSEIRNTLSNIPDVKKVSSHGEVEDGIYEFAVEPETNRDLRLDIWNRMVDRKWPVMGLQNISISLEDIFLHFTGNNSDSRKSGAKRSAAKSTGASGRRGIAGASGSMPAGDKKSVAKDFTESGDDE